MDGKILDFVINHNMAISELKVIKVLLNSEPLTVNEIGEKLSLKYSNVLNILTKLKTRDFLIIEGRQVEGKNTIINRYSLKDNLF
jgi:predicted transcriptional regulator